MQALSRAILQAVLQVVLQMESQVELQVELQVVLRVTLPNKYRARLTATLACDSDYVFVHAVACKAIAMPQTDTLTTMVNYASCMQVLHCPQKVRSLFTRHRQN